VLFRRTPTGVPLPASSGAARRCSQPAAGQRGRGAGRGFGAAGLPTGSGARAGNWAGLATNAFTVASGAAPSANGRRAAPDGGAVPRPARPVHPGGRRPVHRWPAPGGALPVAVTTQTLAGSACTGLPAPADHPVRPRLLGRHAIVTARAPPPRSGASTDRGRPSLTRSGNRRVLLGGRGAARPGRRRGHAGRVRPVGPVHPLGAPARHRPAHRGWCAAAVRRAQPGRQGYASARPAERGRGYGDGHLALTPS